MAAPVSEAFEDAPLDDPPLDFPAVPT